jgi:hypothetical protein
MYCAIILPLFLQYVTDIEDVTFSKANLITKLEWCTHFSTPTFQKAFFKSHIVGRCCTNMISSHCFVFGKSCTNVIQGHCCASFFQQSRQVFLIRSEVPCTTMETLGFHCYATVGSNNRSCPIVARNATHSETHGRAHMVFFAHAGARWRPKHKYFRFNLKLTRPIVHVWHFLAPETKSLLERVSF